VAADAIELEQLSRKWAPHCAVLTWCRFNSAFSVQQGNMLTLLSHYRPDMPSQDITSDHQITLRLHC